jgi:hypothetical protein
MFSAEIFGKGTENFASVQEKSHFGALFLV